MRRILVALANLLLGTVLGLAGFEALLQANPRLLLRGMNASVPLDLPLNVQRYEVHYSDGDVFRWRPDLVRPIQAGEDRLEASVVFQTDELGFRNTPPIPQKVEVVALGRSHTLAAHLPASWTQLLAQTTGWAVLNLAQPGSGNEHRQYIWERFGKTRRPRWVVIEVDPSKDIIGSRPASTWYRRLYRYSPALVSPLVQSLLKRRTGSWISWQGTQPIYPLQITFPGGSVQLTSWSPHLDFFTLDQAALQSSQDWLIYQRELLELAQMIRQDSACVALLVVPTKLDSYFPLVEDQGQLLPVLRELKPLTVGAGGWIVQASGSPLSIQAIVANTDVGRSLVASFAQQNHLALIDPTTLFRERLLLGDELFMAYDTHWNQLGHTLVAHLAEQSLQSQACP